MNTSCSGANCGSKSNFINSDADFTTNANFGVMSPGIMGTSSSGVPTLTTTNQCGQGVVLQGRYKQMTVSCPTKTAYTYQVQVPKKSYRAVPVQSTETFMTQDTKLVPYEEQQQRLRKIKRKVRKPVVTYQDYEVDVPIVERRTVRKFKPVTVQTPQTRMRTNYVTQEHTTMETQLRTGYKEGTRPCTVNVPEYTAACSGVTSMPQQNCAPCNNYYDDGNFIPASSTEVFGSRGPIVQEEFKQADIVLGKDSSNGRQAKFSDMDANGDGVISREEFQKAGGKGFQ